MTRNELLNAIKAAAAQDDTTRLNRLYCENRIARATFDEAVRQGRDFAKFCKQRDEGKLK